MIKRLRWMAIGAGLGLAGWFWLTRRGREVVPEAAGELVESARAGAREFGARLREAVEEGRLTMIERQRELESELLPEEGA